jgi:hypothetical protein
VSPEIDRRAFQNLSYNLYTLTSRDGERLNGQVGNTVIQVTFVENCQKPRGA